MIRTELLSAVSGIALMGSVAAHADVAVTINGVASALPNNGLTSQFAGTAGFIAQNFNGTAIGQLPSWYSGNGQVLGASTGNAARPSTPSGPGLNESRFLTVPTNLTNTPLTVTINLPFLSNYFGLYWGSVDTYNQITFFRNGSQVATYGGQTIISLPDPDLGPGNQSQAVYVNFFFDKGDAYDRVVLASSSFAFESDNHVFGVVPVPGSAMLLLSGILGAAFLGRRRKSAA
jgi:hypothetical protein